jgi:hypothetical protein
MGFFMRLMLAAAIFAAAVSPAFAQVTAADRNKSCDQLMAEIQSLKAGNSAPTGTNQVKASAGDLASSLMKDSAASWLKDNSKNVGTNTQKSLATSANKAAEATGSAIAKGPEMTPEQRKARANALFQLVQEKQCFG